MTLWRQICSRPQEQQGYQLGIDESMVANAGSELPGLYATERMESFWATAPLAQYDTAKQDDLVLNADHMLDATRYSLMATQDNRYQSASGYSTKNRVW